MGHIWPNGTQTWEGESHFINMGHTYQNCGTWK